MGLGLFNWGADGLPLDTPLVVLVALGNAVGPWLAVAFLAGSLDRDAHGGAVAGGTALGTAVLTYYVAGLLGWPGVPAELGQLIAAWLIVATFGGPLLGAAGAAWAGGGRYRALGVAILAGGLLAEAAYRFIEVEGWPGIDRARTSLQVATVDTVVAALLPFTLVDRGRRASAYLGSAVVGLAGLILFAGVIVAIRAVVFGG